MIFIFILLFGVLFLFVNIRQVAPGNRGSIAAGLAVIALPVCFISRGHLWASVGQAFLAVWLCEALLLYIFWWLFRGIRRLALRRPLSHRMNIMVARSLLALSVLVSAVMCVAGYFHNADYYLRRTDVDLPGDSHFTALFFSDLHIDPLFDRDKALRILHDADSVRPDFIFFGGDLSDEHDSLMTLEGYDKIFRDIAGKARVGAFAVDGNHEATWNVVAATRTVGCGATDGLCWKILRRVRNLPALRDVSTIRWRMCAVWNVCRSTLSRPRRIHVCRGLC